MNMTGNALLTPAPDFSTPLELLQACHGRIQAQCATLLRLPGHLERHGADTQAQQAAGAILKYFMTAAPHHHADEEADLFPLVRVHAEAAGNGRVTVLLDNLLAQHRDMEAAWQALQPWLEALAHGEMRPCAPEQLEKFADLYLAHIQHEEQSLLPYARAVLTPAQLATFGQRMAQRRGVSFSGDASV